MGDVVTNDILGIYGKMATLGERKKRCKDRLRPLIRYTFQTLTYRPVWFCFFYVFCQYFFATSLTIFHLLRKFDQETLLKHGSFCGIQIFVLINLGPMIFMVDDLLGFLKRYGDATLPVDMLNDKLLVQIYFLIKIIKAISVINICLAIVAAAGFIAAPEYFDEKTYLCVWIQETFPDYSVWMLRVVHWTSLPVALALAGCSIGWAYGGFISICQILMLHEMIASISNSSLPQKLRRDSRLYQEAVRQKMVMSIMTHEYTVRFQSLASEIIEIPILMVSVGSLILGGSLMIEFFSNQDQNFGDQYELFVGIFCFTVAGVISANTYLITGQVIKDESETCNYKLCQLPWYDMDKDNKKIYSIFLDRSQKNLAIQNSLVQVDFVLLVRVGVLIYLVACMNSSLFKLLFVFQICKGLYSLAAVLAQFAAPDDGA
ncbi:uncharacterized protein LOC123313644 [Coccinella septempunctata]|uniref:uncharacterized protein LOC123313644 n=1 Tax=Coccinella septempunctata TaxID=41139 RepID=UPI001D05EC37|nr:uncharacterized protein LOC123313644 [Coccinella septempunctata]